MHALDEQWRTTELPTTDAEIWRYSRIEELDLGAFEPRPHDASVDRPAGPRPSRRRSRSTCSLTTGPTCSPTSTPRSRRRRTCSCPPASSSSSRSSSPTSVAAGGAMVRPRLVIEAGRDSQVTVDRVLRLGGRRSGARAAGAPGPRRRGRPRPVPRRQPALGRRLVDRASAGGRRARLVDAARHAWRSAATTPGCAPKRGSSAAAPRRARWRSTSPAASRCTTSARSRITPPRTPPATCCSRAPSRTTRRASTPA